MSIKYFLLYFDADAETSTITDTQTEITQTPAETHTDITSQSDKKYSDEDLDRIIGERFKRWQNQQQKAIDEAKRLAAMSAQERAEAERDALQQELDALKLANTRAEMERIARKMLADDGVAVGDDVVTVLVKSDAETTRAAVKSFSESYKSAVQQGVAASLSHKVPIGASAGSSPSKDEIMAIKDPIKRQKAIKENLKLFR